MASIDLDSPSRESRKRIVIVGAGFAGIEAAKQLADADVDVIVIDRRSYHTFQPLLYQVALAVLSASDIIHPIRSVLSRYSNIDVLMEEVVGIDRTQRAVELSTGRSISFDYLVLATGCTSSYFGHDDWASHAPSLKSIPDAVEIRSRVLAAFERGESEALVGMRSDIHFVIIGGGPTGVELAGAIADISQRVIARDFHYVRTQDSRISIFEGSPSILAAFAPGLQMKALEQLQSLGVAVHTNARITKIGSDYIIVGSEKIHATVILWAAGVAPSPLGGLLNVPLDRKGAVVVNEHLNPPEEPTIFVCDDLAAVTENGRRVPAVAQPAMQMGKHAARLILADLSGKPRTAFHYFDKGDMATIGARKAVARVAWPFTAQLSGRLAWFAWLFVHLAYLGGLDRQLSVLFTWVVTYITKTARSRIIATSETEIGTSGG